MRPPPCKGYVGSYVVLGDTFSSVAYLLVNTPLPV